MADFNAGSIEGRLDLDTDPFVRGLREAKARAEEFEKTTAATATADFEVNDAAAKASMIEDEAALKRLDHKRSTAEVRVDNSQASAALAALERQVDKAAGFYKQNSAAGLGGGGGHGLAYLIGLAAALAPALGPATAAVGLFGGAAIAAFGGAAVSMALWGKVTAGVFKQISDANKAGITLTGSIGQLQAAVKGLGGAWEDLQKKAAPGIATALIPTIHTLQTLLPKLLPLLNNISKGVGGALRPIDNLLKGGQFDRFVKLLGSNAVKDLPQVGHALANILSGLMGMFTALNPVIQLGLPIIVRMTKEFSKWSQTGAGAWVHDLFNTIQTYGPLTIQMLHNLFGALGSIAKGLAPLAGPALLFLSGLFAAIKNLDLEPLAKGVGDVLAALTPFLTVIGQLVNVLLPPFGTLLSTIADSFIGPLGSSLSEELTPALDAFAGILQTLAPYLGEFISAIADLVNPTMIGMLVSLITGLAPIVEQLIPPVMNLAIALEGMVDDFLLAVGPAVIPALISVLGALADVLVPVINGLAWFLDHEGVAVTILGLAVAVKAVTTAMKIWAAVTKGIAIITGIIEGIAAATVAMTVATDASTAAIAANRIALVLMKGVMFAVTVATKAWAAVTKVLNLLFIENPIGLVIVAIAALVVGVIYAYKHSETFRSIVQALWDVLKATGEWLAGAGIAVWHSLGKAFDFVRSHLRLFMLLLGPLGVAINVVITIVKHWSQIVGIAKAAWNAVIGWLRGVPGKIKAIFAGAAGWLLDKGKDVIHGLWNGIKWFWSHTLIGFLIGIGPSIPRLIGNLSKTLYNAGWALISGFWEGIKDKFEHLISDAKGKLQDLLGIFPHSPAKTGPLSGAGWARHINSGVAFIQGFAEGIRRGTPDAERAADSALTAVSRALTLGVGSVVGTASINLSTTRPGYAPDLQAQAQTEALASLISALAGLTDQMKSMSKEDRDAMTDSLSKAFSAASVASTQKVITAVKKR